MVHLSWNFPPFVTVASVRGDGNGAFSAPITVPEGAPIGPTEVNAINEAGDLTWQAPFTVTSADVSFFEPFPCGETWYADSRTNHSPSKYALDWNKEIGDGNEDEGQVVVASQSGTVAEVGEFDEGYGKSVLLSHFNGAQSTLYAHLKEIRITAGQSVRIGDSIGTVGSTGRSTHAHLHYEQRLGLQGINGLDVANVLPTKFRGVGVSYDEQIWGTGKKFVSGNNCHVPSTADEAGANTPNSSAWQNTRLKLSANQRFLILRESGSWTVDYRNFPYVRLGGYPESIDRRIYQGCKYNASWPYAVLLGKIGIDGTPFRLSRERSYKAPRGGTLFLGIHDRCLLDNRGSLAIRVALPPKIVRAETFRQGVLVFFRLFFTDPNNDAIGFGFNWAGLGEENHPFSSPSYGRVFRVRIEYPFNLGCGTGSQNGSDVEAWIYDKAGLRSPSKTVHLACSAPVN